MKILFDAHAIGSKQGGNETYIRNLLAELIHLSRSHEDFTIIPAFATSSIASDWSSRFGIDAVTLGRGGAMGRLLRELPSLARRSGVDLIHSQYFTPPKSSIPFVTTIHDTTYETHPQFFDRTSLVKARIGTRVSTRVARRILTVSETSKKDICLHHGVSPDKIDVTLNGVDHRAFFPVPMASARELLEVEYGLAGPYVLALGNIQPRKNLVGLVRAFARVREYFEDTRLVIIGKEQLGLGDIREEIISRRLTEVVSFTGYVPDDHLPHFLSATSVFAYPSFYEGFGLPVLEAMACGSPVVASKVGAVPEVTGQSTCLLVNPDSPQEISDAICTLLGDRNQARDLGRAGLERSKTFTWTRTAMETLNGYSRALD